MRIRNANIYTEEHRFVRGDAAVENGRFVSCTGEPAGEEAVVDAEGMYLIPGLVDIHFHGCKGADMCDGTKEALDVITSYEASVGVTSVCPATMTIPKDELLEVMKNAGSYEYSGGSHLVGINMEGPFISPAKKGAQAAENIMHCDYEYFSRLQKAANGLIKLVDIAPEEPGAMEFIDRAKGEVVISLAHTASGYDTAREAIEHGASHATHLYNAMPPLNHREPGVIGAVSAVFVMAAVKKKSPFQILDTIALALLNGQMLGRWGNFFNREAFGEYTNNLLAMQLPVSAVRENEITSAMWNHVVTIGGVEYIQVHPTFLYESALNLLLLIVLLLYTKHKKFNGEIALGYLGGYGIIRFFVEGIRTDQLKIGSTGIAVSQLLGMVLFIAAILADVIVRIYRRKKGLQELPQKAAVVQNKVENDEKQDE